MTRIAARRTLLVYGSLAAAVAGALHGGPVQAAEPAVGGLEEVVVTAQRRETNLQTTPIAVSALDSALIQQVNPTNLGDLAAYVPNFSATKITGFNAAAFAMRGVGNTDIIVYNEPPIAVLIDDFVVPSPQTQLLDAFDIGSVEVLRGPQGTLFGKNTTGGVVVVRTKEPRLDAFAAEVRAEFGKRETLNTQASLDIPLVADTLGLRLVASRQKEDGYMKNGAVNTILGTTFRGDGRTVGGTEVTTARAKLLWQPSENFRALLQYEFLADRSETPTAVNETPNDPATFFWAGLGWIPDQRGSVFERGGLSNVNDRLIGIDRGQFVDVDGIYLNVDWDFGSGTLTSVSGYRAQDSSLAGTETGNSVFPTFDINRSDLRDTWSQEIRFASHSDGAFNYVVGAFHQHDDTRFCVAQIRGFLDGFGVPLTPGLEPGGYVNNPSILCNAQNARSTAGFGEFNYAFSDRMTLTLGARWTREEKRWTGRTQVYVQQLPSPTGQVVPSFTWRQLGSVMAAGDFSRYPFGVVRDEKSWSEPTYRASLAYEFSDTLFGYATFSRGFKAGGYNDQVGTAFTPITDVEKRPTNPEKADSFEIGLKSELMDNRLRFNSAVFYVTYKDAIRQVVAVVPDQNGRPTQQTLFLNAAEMTAYGIENEITAQITEGLTLRLPFSYQKCEYDAFSSVGSGYNLEDAPVSRCPEWTATVDVNYSTPVGAAGHKLTFAAAANHVSKNAYTLSYTNPRFTTFAEARTLVDASVTFGPEDERWFVRAIGRNLTDEVYRNASQNVEPLWLWSFYGEPRYYGVQAGFRFGQL